MVDFYQPDSDQAVLRGYDFFRLNTLLSCPGDIWESKQSGYSFALGPESDVANVGVAYFDDQVQTFVNQMVIGPNRPWDGRINARNEAYYAPSNRPGRILFYAADLYDPAFVPTGVGVGDSVIQVTPRIDIIESFRPNGDQPAGRLDKVFSYQELPLPANDLYLILPYWGRKTASIRISNLTSGNLDYSIWGVNYYMNDASPHAALETQIVGTATIATTAQALKVVKEGTDGMFDALMLILSAATADGPTPVQIITSDTPVG